MVQTFYFKTREEAVKYVLEPVKELGLYTIADHPWHKGELAKMAKELGFKVRPEKAILRKTPEWAKARGHWKAASKPMKRVWRAMKAVAETADTMDVRVPALLKLYDLPLPVKKGKDKVREEVKEKRRLEKKPMWAEIDEKLGPEVVARILEEVRKCFETNRSGIAALMDRYGGKKEKYDEALRKLVEAIATVRR